MFVPSVFLRDVCFFAIVSACSTVLLPDRVVQALKLNLEAMDAQSQVQNRYSGTFSFDYGEIPNNHVR